ncbi:MAG: hypothetical protein ABEI58_00855 [Candidatus Nanohaloarchaea archaeon]
MKGQFMVISAVVIGVILISASATISGIQNRRFQVEGVSYEVDNLKSEALKVDMSSPEERDNFRRMVDMMDSFESDTDYWRRQNCFNVTLERPGDVIRMRCIG